MLKKKTFLKYHTVLYSQVSSEQHMKLEKVPLILWGVPVGDVQLREGLLQCAMTTEGLVMAHS